MKKKFAMGFVLVLTLSLAAQGAAIESLIDWMRGGTFSYDFTLKTEGGGSVTEAKGKMAAQGNKFSVYTESKANGADTKSRVISKDGDTYIVDEINRFVMKVSGAMAGQTTEGFGGMIADYSAGMKKTGEGEGVVNGKKLPYEAYEVDGNVSKFYMDGGQVYAIESEGSGYKTLMVITNASKTVPAGAFNIPNDYTKMGF
ncbi:MAG: hypothetical protein LBT08_03435 [Synergistaceae bacterium]|jgi:hypothetical protein|nr:hypothetical protein [Synergistaceae bacterium]